MTYQAEARVICRIQGATGAATISGPQAPILSHLTLSANSITQRLMSVPSYSVGEVPDNDKAACFAKAQTFVANELPPTYSVANDAQAVAIPGHALIAGRWVRFDGGGIVSHAFEIKHKNEPIGDEILCKDSAGNEQSMVLGWFVVIQPKA